MKEVLNFTIVKSDGVHKYRIAKELKNCVWRYYLQYQSTYQGFLTYTNESDEFWLSMDAVVASAKFQNLFK